MAEHRIADACCLQGRNSGVRHDADSSEEDTPQRAEVANCLIGDRFGEFSTGGASNMGRMCVECQHCDAMLWVCECDKVSTCTQPRCLAR